MLKPTLSIAIKRLRLNQAGTANFAIWVIDSTLPEGFAHHDCIWFQSLTQAWLDWQEMFSLTGQSHVPVTHEQQCSTDVKVDNFFAKSEGPYSTRLMQHLGICLWKWVFDDSISSSFEQHRGFAIGQKSPLRVRLEIRDPYLIPLPWEIMIPSVAKPAISLNQQIIFSRTTTDVEPLRLKDSQQHNLKILLVLGQKQDPNPVTANNLDLIQLEADAQILKRVFQSGLLSAQVDTLLQPTPAELIDALDQGDYNLFFYSGHGERTSDGGLLFLKPEVILNGVELAQVLVRNQVILAVFNACWSAQPEQLAGVMIERSSLTEVLIHYGVPAVIGMRDSITDPEALTFIEAFSQAIAKGIAIDEAVRVARQRLLTIYGSNQPAWTLPILYMHPDFDGILLTPTIKTQLPPSIKPAYLRLADNQQQIWEILGLTKIGRHSIGKSGKKNDVVLTETWVSSEHALIFYHKDETRCGYCLRDFSTFGTYINRTGEWEFFHLQDIPLDDGVQIRFGAIEAQILEFLLEKPTT